MKAYISASTKTWRNRPSKTAKPLFIGSIPIAASNTSIYSIVYGHTGTQHFRIESLLSHFREIAQKTWVTKFARNAGNFDENRR